MEPHQTFATELGHGIYTGLEYSQAIWKYYRSTSRWRHELSSDRANVLTVCDCISDAQGLVDVERQVQVNISTGYEPFPSGYRFAHIV